MNIEKFSIGGKNGYKIVGATFASSRNNNGAHFDPIEVFSLDNPPVQFNYAHKDYDTDFSSDTTITKMPTGAIEGKMLRFTWDIETTNLNFVALIEAENFGGFSPELFPKNLPLKSDIGERFYRSGDLVWKNTAILAKDQQPGFVGANEYKLEKFEAFEDVVIKTEDEEVIPVLPPAAVEKKDDEAPVENEKFSFYGNVGDYARTSTGQIGKVIKIEELENYRKNHTLTLLDGSQLIIAFSGDYETDKDLLHELRLKDIMDFLINLSKPTESFKTKNEEPTAEEKAESEKFEKTKLETEHFNQIATAKKAIEDTKQIQHGVGDDGVESEKFLSSAINKLNFFKK